MQENKDNMTDKEHINNTEKSSNSGDKDTGEHIENSGDGIDMRSTNSGRGSSDGIGTESSSIAAADKPGKKFGKRNIILLSVIAAVIVISFGIIAYMRNTARTKASFAKISVDIQYGNVQNGSDMIESSDTATSEPKLSVVVQYVDREIFRAPLDKDALYMIKDGEVSEVSRDTTLASLGDEALETRHHINLMLVEDGAVSVVESNCSNQVCVSIGKLTGSDYDFPITCLPHGLIIVIE